LAMKEAICQLPNPEGRWRRFLAFDGRITSTILQECEENKVAICNRSVAEEVDVIAQKVAKMLDIRH
jgi:hypothetical protein